MNVKEAFEARRSIRYFSDQQDPEETLRDNVKDAQWAPSWANAQPWKVYIATGETAAAIRSGHKQLAMTGHRGRADMETGHRTDWGMNAAVNMQNWSNDLQRYLGYSDVAQFSMAQAELFDAPALVYITMHKNSPLWSIYDMGAFGQSLMLSAKEHGVDSMPAYEVVKFPQEARKALGIPDDETLVMGFGIGYADDRKINGFRSDRVPVDEILTIKR